MNVLGVSGHATGAAAALVVDGVLASAAREEDVAGARRDVALPWRAARTCLREAGLTTDRLDRVVFHEKPLRAFERVLVTQLRGFPRSMRTFTAAMAAWLGERLWVRNEIAAGLGVDPVRVGFVEHHRALAAAAFLASPFEDATILTVAQAGEWATTSLARGSGRQVELVREIHHPHGLGVLLEAAARWLRLDPHDAAAAIDAIARWGEPSRLREIADLVTSRDDGSFVLDAALLADAGARARDAGARGALVARLGAPRAAGAPLRWTRDDPVDADVAASVQELVVRALARVLETDAPGGEPGTMSHARGVPGTTPYAGGAPAPVARSGDRLCLAGDLGHAIGIGTALLERTRFTELFVPPADGPASAALGAALLAGAPGRGRDVRWDVGPAIGDEASAADPDALVERLASRLAEGVPVGWAFGRHELAPISLGRRAILADARDAASGERLRAIVRGPAHALPAVLVTAEDATRWFALPRGSDAASRWGMIAARPREDAPRALAALAPGRALRVHAVHARDVPPLHALLVAFAARTGVPVLLHETMRRHGHPTVCDAASALDLLARTPLELLAIGRDVHETPSPAPAL